MVILSDYTKKQKQGFQMLGKLVSDRRLEVVDPSSLNKLHLKKLSRFIFFYSIYVKIVHIESMTASMLMLNYFVMSFFVIYEILSSAKQLLMMDIQRTLFLFKMIFIVLC